MTLLTPSYYHYYHYAKPLQVCEASASAARQLGRVYRQEKVPGLCFLEAWEKLRV